MTAKTIRLKGALSAREAPLPDLLLGLTQCGSPLVNLRQLQLQKLAYVPMHLGQDEFVLRR
jgi:hypothetical protein